MALAAGLSKDCAANSGGIKRIAIANEADVSGVTYDTTDVATVITVASGGKKFHEFEFEQDTAEWRENGELINGSLKYTQELEFFIRKNNNTNRTALAELGSNCGFIVVIEDMNGTLYILGHSSDLLNERPMKLASDATASGKELTDLAGSTMTLTAMSVAKANTVDSSITIDSLLVATT
jgi:hypothetical protein